ncbi:MAG: hypothetical protein J6R82_01040 [Clostridia bacterium]|nr:hypothetical protein [Clostridia bacterium]
MKKTLALVLAGLLAMTALVSCTEEPADTTPAATTTTPAVTTTTGTKPIIIPDPEPTGGDDVGEEDYTYDFPNAKAGDTALKAVEVSGYGLYEDEVTSDSGNYMAIFTNDKMSSGKLTATFTGLEGSGANDNGIVFGMADFEEGSFFWEDGPAYYFLFVSDRGSLYLSKVSYNGSPWNVCVDTAETIEGYVHGDQVTISVEWDGAGSIKCYANGNLMIEYADADPLVGTNYGVRCEVAGVVYHSVVAEHN